MLPSQGKHQHHIGRENQNKKDRTGVGKKAGKASSVHPVCLPVFPYLRNIGDEHAKGRNGKPQQNPTLKKLPADAGHDPGQPRQQASQNQIIEHMQQHAPAQRIFLGNIAQHRRDGTSLESGPGTAAPP